MIYDLPSLRQGFSWQGFTIGILEFEDLGFICDLEFGIYVYDARWMSN
jgi:hypothetical protein